MKNKIKPPGTEDVYRYPVWKLIFTSARHVSATLMYLTTHTFCLYVCFHPLKQKKKKESFPSPLTRQTDSVGGRRGEQGMWALGLPVWGSQLTGERSLALHHSSLWRPLTVDGCFSFLILTPQKGSRRRRNSSSLSKLH